MTEFVNTFISIFVTATLFLVQKALSSRKTAWLGGIMPMLTLIVAAGLIWYMKWTVSFRTVFPFGLLFLMFVITWLAERSSIKKKQQTEK